MFRGKLAALFCLAVFLAPAAASAANWTFRLQFDKKVRAEPFTGRVLILFSQNLREPRNGPNWFTPEQFISLDVENWKPGTVLTLSAANPGKMHAYPIPLSEMKLTGWRAQAVVRFNPFVRTIGRGPGNGFSQVVRLGAVTQVPVFNINRVVPEARFVESKWVKLLKVKSKLLSKFYGRDVYMQASVRLPAGYYDNPKKQYPTIFTIPGFGGTHRVRSANSPIKESNKEGVEFLRVQLDPSCPRGHHVFADSENNGPVGKALIKEFIPAFNKKYRSIAKPEARFLTGHSSGGWSSLWLQVAYPDQFAGTWSTSPDPVDFRDFQRINLYKPGENMYVDADGKKRPLARFRGQVRLWYKGFADMEWTLGPGGQLHSFEAVFSRKGKDGTPELLWDRKTGKINTKVANTWKKYDIRLILESRWKTLGPKLKGKLHVFMGDADTFYLEGATVLLKKSHEKLESDAVVEIHPGKDHGTLLSPDMRSRIRKEMVDVFLTNFPDYATEKTSAAASIIPAGAKLEMLWNEGDFTEGVAVAPDGAIYFSDIPFNMNAGRVLKFDPETKKVTVHSADSGKSNGLMFDRKGRLIAACGAMWGRQALVEITADGKVKPLVERFKGKRLNSPNDVVVHPNGWIYFSDPRYAGDEAMEIPEMSVYRFDPKTGKTVRATTDIEKPNGVGVSPDGKTLYVAETNNGSTDVRKKQAKPMPGRMTLNAFPINKNGTLGTKRVLVDFGTEVGTDGMTVDAAGNIYAAVRSTKRHGIIVFSPKGKERAYIPTEDLPTNCCFGKGKDAHTLYVTAGKGLFRIKLNSTGYHPATAK